MAIYGLFSDAHGNRDAFNIAVEALYNHGAKHLFFLGDSVGYIPSLSVLSAIQSLGSDITCIRGNHENMLLRPSAVNAQVDEIYQINRIRDMYNEKYAGLVESWPDHLNLPTNADVLCIHGSPHDFSNGYIYPDSNLNAYTVSSEYIFMGHTHRPFIRHFNNKKFMNVGSCGLPRDYGSLGSAALYDDQARTMKIIRFDISHTFNQILLDNDFIHPAVVQLFSRTCSPIVGEILC